MKKWTRFVVGLIFSMILTGCTSYRFSGDHGSVQPRSLQDVTFRLRNFVMQVEKPDFYATSAAVSSVNKKDIERVLLSVHPDLFTQSSASLPLDVQVVVTDLKTKKTAATLAFVFTLGILAPSYSWAETCNVYVDVDGLDEQGVRPETLKLISHVRMSFLSPLGSVLPAEPIGYSGTQRALRGPLTTSFFENEVAKNRNVVFVEEVVAGIVNAVTHRDQNKLKRAAILQRFSGESR